MLGWFPTCYTTYQNLLPTPVVILEENGEQGVYIIPDSVELINLLGPDFTDFFDTIGFNWQRLAGAKVLTIADSDPFDYLDLIARTQSGNYIDHNVRVNSVVSSYRISGTDFSQRFGDLGGPALPILTNLKFGLITKNGTRPEIVEVPYLASFVGSRFTDRNSL